MSIKIHKIIIYKNPTVYKDDINVYDIGNKFEI